MVREINGACTVGFANGGGEIHMRVNAWRYACFANLNSETPKIKDPPRTMFEKRPLLIKSLKIKPINVILQHFVL